MHSKQGIFLITIINLCGFTLANTAKDDKPLECTLRMSDKLNAVSIECSKKYEMKIINSKNPTIRDVDVDHFLCLLNGLKAIKNPKTAEINYELLLNLIDDFPSPLKEKENLKFILTACRDFVKLSPDKGRTLVKNLLGCLSFMFYQTRNLFCDM